MNSDQLWSHPTVFSPQTNKNMANPPSQEESGSAPWESIKFGVLERKRVTEIIKKKKTWSQAGWKWGSDRNWGHKVINCSSMRFPWNRWVQKFSSRTTEQGTVILIQPYRDESHQGANQHQLVEARATEIKLWPPEIYFHRNMSVWESAQWTLS